MQVGSLVECIDDNFRHSNQPVRFPVKGSIYTVIGFIEKPRGLGIYLAEFENEIIVVEYPDGRIKEEHPPFNYKHFREVMPPFELKITESLELLK